MQARLAFVSPAIRLWMAGLFALLLGVTMLSGCAALLYHDPIRVNVVGIEPVAGEGLELRFAVKLRLQNPNEIDLSFDGLSLELQLAGMPVATGVSNQKGMVPRFGDTVLSVPVSISVLAAARQAITMAGSQQPLPYVLTGKLAGGVFGTMRFRKEGTVNWGGDKSGSGESS